MNKYFINKTLSSKQAFLMCQLANIGRNLQETDDEARDGGERKNGEWMR
jgi:hypothetical protein